MMKSSHTAPGNSATPFPSHKDQLSGDLPASIRLGRLPICRDQSILGFGNRADAIWELGGPVQPGSIVIAQQGSAILLPCWAPKAS